MAWNYQITDSLGVLTQAQMEENAQMFYSYFQGYMTIEAMAGILGNIQRESQLNPGQQESGYGGSLSYGHGLIQWTPGSIIVNWCTERGLNWYDGDAQCYRIKCEGEAIEGAGGTWLTTEEYPYTWAEFCKLTDVAEATKSYLAERERAGVSALDLRLQYAAEWYDFLSGNYKYTPRLNSTGITGNPWYYDLNPFYQSGYGLPNCTCYAWGRRGEITGKAPNLSLGDASSWWQYNLDNNVYPYGQTPKLGAIACWSYTGDKADDGGHVGIVEQINDDGSIITSNSAYGGTFFYTQTLNEADGYEWASYTNFQGFIYLENNYTPDIPIPSAVRRKSYNFILFNKQRRRRTRR